MEVKTSEYNIGDLVCSHGHICMVYAVGKEYDTCKGRRSYWLKTMDGKGIDLGENDSIQIYPIPLGEVNIKAVGFKETEPYQGFFLKSRKLLLIKDGVAKYGLYAYHKIDKKIWKKGDWRDVIDGVKLASLENFHELQHILRSLSIKYNIDYNFKQ